MTEDKLPAKVEEVKEIILVPDDTIYETVSAIEGLYIEKSNDLVYSIGDCILKNLFGNDLKNIRGKKYTDSVPFLKLIEICGERIAGLSKSWLYGSLTLLIDREDLKDCDEYQHLSVSLKHEISSLPDIPSKVSFAKDLAQYGYTVKEARDRKKAILLEHQKKAGVAVSKKDTKKVLRSFINKPTLLVDSDNKTAAKGCIEKLNDKEKIALSKNVQVKLDKVYSLIKVQNCCKLELEQLLKELKPTEVAKQNP